MPRLTRPVSWVRAALKEFQSFPIEAQGRINAALTIAAEGEKADIAKPFKGVGSGVFEIAIKHRGDAFRVIYTVEFAIEVVAVDAFQKKSNSGIKTPQRDVERIKERLKQLRDDNR